MTGNRPGTEGYTNLSKLVNLVTNLRRWTYQTAMEAAARGPCQKASNIMVQLVVPLTGAHTQFPKNQTTFV
jgi:hypothetical protein